MPSSKVLILATCSNHKDREGPCTYDPTFALVRTLPDPARMALIERRRKACSLLKGPAERDFARVGNHPYNLLLNSRGFDFGYDAKDAEADYLPAVMRYTGRFYGSQGMASDGSVPIDLCIGSTHHMLIVSALYGLTSTMEPIQRYSLSINDHPKLRDLWISGGGLTDILLSYCTEYGIERIFDLTGEESYRSLFEWPRISHQVACGILHAFSQLNAGHACLPSLGNLARDLLRTDESELLLMRHGLTTHVADEVLVLTESREPPDGWPREPVEATCTGTQTHTHGSETGPAPITSAPHRTIFGDRIVHSLRHLPPEAREVLAPICMLPGVRRVKLGPFCWAGSPSECTVLVDRPSPNAIVLFAKLRGPGKNGTEQDLTISVLGGQEQYVFHAMQSLPHVSVRGEKDPL